MTTSSNKTKQNTLWNTQRIKVPNCRNASLLPKEGKMRSEYYHCCQSAKSIVVNQSALTDHRCVSLCLRVSSGWRLVQPWLPDAAAEDTAENTTISSTYLHRFIYVYMSICLFTYPSSTSGYIDLLTSSYLLQYVGPGPSGTGHSPGKLFLSGSGQCSTIWLWEDTTQSLSSLPWEVRKALKKII